MSENNDCQGGWCGPAPFANTPPIGLAPELQTQEEVMPDWKALWPSLPEDSYATADALWWSRKLGSAQALGADVATLMRSDADARSVQRALARSWNWWPADRAPLYWKSGGPGRDKALLHVPLPEDGIRQGLPLSPPPQTVFKLRAAEAEIALRIGQDVNAEQAAALNDASALALVDAFTVAIEWVDMRWREGLDAPALALLADGQCHGGLALGEWLPATTLAGRNWSEQRCTVTINGGQSQSFTGTHSLGDPSWLLRDWIQHVVREYGSLSAGTVVTTGTWCGCMPLNAGDRFEMEFDGLGRLGWQF